MNKKPYKAPVVKKVKLEIKDAILAVCHSSTITTPKGSSTCEITPRCYQHK